MSTPSLNTPLVVLSGAGLSAASGVPTFRDADGLWEGHDVTRVATPEAFVADGELVRRFYDERRVAGAKVEPNAGHYALAELQDALGTEDVVLITQNVDGLLDRAGCRDVIEMHGSLWRLRCEHDLAHPRTPVDGRQDPSARCPTCGGRMRPDVVWFGEIPYDLDRIDAAMRRCRTFVAVGTSGLVYPAAGLSIAARRMGALTLEVNPQPAGGPFDHIIPLGSEVALPRLVDAWLGR